MSFLDRIPIVNILVEWSKKYSIPGFRGLSIYEIISFVYQEARNDDIYSRANSVAFSFFLAIFPTIIFLFTLIPLFAGTTDFIEAIKNTTENLIPATAHEYLFEMIDDVATTKRGGLRSIGAVLALFFASSGMLTLMNGFDKNYDVFKKRHFLNKRLTAIYLTTLLVGLLAISFVLIVFGKQLIQLGIDYLEFQPYATITFMTFRFIGIFVIFYLGITLIYRLGPSLINRVPFWNPGAFVATGFSISSSIAFAFFVNNFGRYNEIYGSIGALIVIMIWLQINAFIIIVGFELNASVAVAGKRN